jgi:antitoxin component of MazEF toxin-antitoxin module
MTNTFLFRDPGKNKQVIPGAVMGMAGLEQAECLRIHAEGGHILISDSDLTPREKVNLITQLYKDIAALCKQLVDASNKISGEFLLKNDPLSEVDEDIVADLLCMGADEDRLRVLLMNEMETQDEE